MSAWRGSLACALWFLLAGGPATGLETPPDARVLLVDPTRVETGTVTLERIRAEARSRQPALLPAQQQQGVELALSAILTEFPAAVAAVAQSHRADLVVQSAAWPEDAGAAPADVTQEVIDEIDRRLAQLKFEAP